MGGEREAELYRGETEAKQSKAGGGGKGGAERVKRGMKNQVLQGGNKQSKACSCLMHLSRQPGSASAPTHNQTRGWHC